VRKGLSTLVTTTFKNPATPVAGEAIWTVGVAGAVTAAVVSALVLLAADSCVADTALESDAVAEDRVTAASTTLTEVAGFDDAVGDDAAAALTAAEGSDSGLAFARVGVGGWVSGSEVDGGVLG